jgi:hypothetical protein
VDRVEKRAILCWSQAGQVIEAKSERGRTGIERTDQAGIREKDSEAEVIFGTDVGKAMSSHERKEGTLFVRVNESRTGEEGKEDEH